MSRGLLALGVVAIVSFALILRDTAVPRGPERFIIAGSWPAMIALFALLNHSEVDRLGFAGVLASVCIATLGRPALIMDLAITREAERDRSLNGRKAAGIVALVISALAAAAWSTWGR